MDSKTSASPAQRGFAMAAEIITSPDFLPMFNSYRLVTKQSADMHQVGRVMSELGKAMGDAELAASQMEMRRSEQHLRQVFERFTPEHWPPAFAALLHKRKAVQWFDRVIAGGQAVLRQQPVDEVLVSRPLSPASQAAFRRARQHLVSAPASDARWWALASFALACMIGTTSSRGFNDDTWSDFVETGRFAPAASDAYPDFHGAHVLSRWICRLTAEIA